jgi:hypothetical protein
LNEIMSVGGNSLRGIFTTTQECVAKAAPCGFPLVCCGEPCLLLYDDIDFTFDNKILLLCDSIFKLALLVKGTVVVVVNGGAYEECCCFEELYKLYRNREFMFVSSV